jgi:hypothetical protein
LIDDPTARVIIAAALGEAVDSAVYQHHDALTQEHQLTSRIAERLETAIPRLGQATGYEVSVYTQELPDKGPGALERSLGADLYVGVQVRAGGDIKSKGFLVQSKWQDAIERGRGRQDLIGQCDVMVERTKSGYVWLYGRRGARVVTAKSILRNPDRPLGRVPFSRRPDRLFDGVLKCREGDQAIGLPPMPGGADAAVVRQAIGAMLSELGAGAGVGIFIDRRF